MSEKGTDKLPKIREDPDTGRRYVMVGKKRIWLAKGVTRKTLLKFLLKLRKKNKRSTSKRRKSTTKKKVQFKPAVFGENIALSLASKAIMNSQAKAPSDKKELEELQKKVDKLLETKKDDKLMIAGAKPEDQYIDMGDGVVVRRNDLERFRVQLHAQSKEQEKKDTAAKKGVSEAEQKTAAAIKNKNDAVKFSKQTIDLERAIPVAELNLGKVGKETLEKRAKKRGKTLGVYLKDMAKYYGVSGKDGKETIAALLEPVRELRWMMIKHLCFLK